MDLTNSVDHSFVKSATMLKTTHVLLGILALVGSQSTSVDRCLNDGDKLPINTYIENCPSPPCQLPQLQDAVVHIIFRAPYTMRSMRTLAYAFIYGSNYIDYNLRENAVTCNFLTNTYCPVLKNEVIQYTLRMYIQPFFPPGTHVTIEFRIVDENRSPVLCFRVPIAITPPLPAYDSIGLTASNRTLDINTYN